MNNSRVIFIDEDTFREKALGFIDEMMDKNLSSPAILLATVMFAGFQAELFKEAEREEQHDSDD